MSESSLFQPRLLVLWVVLTALTFGLTLWFMIHGESETAIGPGTFSKSALGYAGIAEILERSQIPVIRAKSDALHRVGGKGVVVLAEPDGAALKDGRFDRLLHARILLLVLPKWQQGQADRANPEWIDTVEAVAPADVTATLTRAVHRGSVLPSKAITSWTRNDLGPEPHFSEAVQLMKSDRLRPIIAAEDGILLGEMIDAGRRIWVLSDPDVIANHGLVDGNAEFALALFQRLRGNGTVVFDETVHGFDSAPPDPLALVLDKRFTAVTIEAVAALLLLFWATIGRFGAAQIPPAPLSFGKQSLIRNIADLMAYAGHQPTLVRRYVEATLRNTANQMNVPRNLDAAATRDWLQQRSLAQGNSIDLAALTGRAEALAAARNKDLAALFGVAREIRQWKQEMIDGASGHPPDRGRDTRRGSQGGGRPG